MVHDEAKTVFQAETLQVVPAATSYPVGASGRVADVMLCRKPFTQGLAAFGCGQCLPCRINRRRLWTHRIMLETIVQVRSLFVTLTYNEEKLPENGSLDPRDPQLWLKRIRKGEETSRLRYFLVGEYGDRSWRPHYHLALWGSTQTQVCKTCSHQYRRQDCDCFLVRTWGMGNIFVGDLNKDSAQYIAGYVVKKMTAKSDDRLKGKYPEFCRMSLRPGIGYNAMDSIADVLKGIHRADILSGGDVPTAINHGSKSFPLGRYLRTQLRKKAGVDEETAKEANSRRWTMEMRELLGPALKDKGNTSKSIPRIIKELNDQKAVNQERRFKIFSKKEGVL